MTDGLAPLARLALAYAPRPARADWLTLLALDARLAGVVRQAREPMLGQLKLAWWRDRLSGERDALPKGEPLLARLGEWADPAALVGLVDGWEALLGEEPDAAMFTGFAAGRAAGIGALAARLGAGDGGAVEAAARRWALADLGLHLGDPAGQDVIRGLLPLASPARLPSAMRPLAILAGTTGRAFTRGGLAALQSPGAFATAVRIGLFGR